MAKTWPTVKDRNVATPSRVKLTTPVGIVGEPIYDIEPITGTVVEEGTPINKDLFEAIHTYVDTPATTEVAGVVKPDGTSIKVTEDGTLSMGVTSAVTGVKGNDEAEYRSGQVNLTSENIGALPVNGSAVSIKDTVSGAAIKASRSQSVTSTPWFACWESFTLKTINPLNSRITMSAAGADTSSGWCKLTFPDGSTEGWLQTTQNGILPIAANSSSLGSWDYQFGESRVRNPYKQNRSMQGYAVIYNNTAGSNGTVTCTESCANFSWIEIVFKTNDNSYNTAKVYGPNGKSIDLMGVSSKDSGTLYTYYKIRKVTISGATISNTSGYISTESVVASNNSCNVYSANNVFITQVIGYV